jgi:hypothetical protein
MKRIVDGQTYNTETSTEVFIVGNSYSDAGLPRGSRRARARASRRNPATANRGGCPHMMGSTKGVPS